MVRNIDTSLLRSFVTAAETQSVTIAARQLNLTQAAVSQQIKRLEELFQTTLFGRERRGLQITREGQRLLAKAQRMLALNDDIWSSMMAPEFEGEVKIGVPDDIISIVMPPVLKSFDRAWPRVQVTLRSSTTTKLREALDNGEIDLTLTTENDCDPGGETLLTDRLVWVGAAGGSAHLRNPLPVSLGDGHCAFRPVASQRLMAMKREWRSVCEDASTPALHATIEADLAICTLLSSTVPAHFEVLSDNENLPVLPNFHINLYTRTANLSELAMEFADHIRRAFHQNARAA